MDCLAQKPDAFDINVSDFQEADLDQRVATFEAGLKKLRKELNLHVFGQTPRGALLLYDGRLTLKEITKRQGDESIYRIIHVD